MQRQIFIYMKYQSDSQFSDTKSYSLTTTIECKRRCMCKCVCGGKPIAFWFSYICIFVLWNVFSKWKSKCKWMQPTKRVSVFVGVCYYNVVAGNLTVVSKISIWFIAKSFCSNSLTANGNTDSRRLEYFFASKPFYVCDFIRMAINLEVISKYVIHV